MANIKRAQEEIIAAKTDFGDVYLKSLGGQLMRPVKATITLKESLGHLYSFLGKTYITGAGYVILNKVASINIVTPRSVVVDGREENNPYVERNPKTRAIEAVACRKIGIGYGPLGNIVVLDKTLYYNVYTYFIQSLMAKMKRAENQKDKYAMIGTEDKRPEGSTWVFFETTPPLGIWARYDAKEIQELLEEKIRMERFGERIAQKICERNILRDHPAIGTARVDATKGVARVTVYGWRNELEPSDIEEIMVQAEKGETKGIEVQRDVIETNVEEVKEAIEEEEATDQVAGREQEKPLFGSEEK